MRQRVELRHVWRARRVAAAAVVSLCVAFGLSQQTATADSNKPATPSAGRPEPTVRVPTKTKVKARIKTRTKAATKAPVATKTPTKTTAKTPPRTTAKTKKRRVVPADNVSVAFCDDFLRLSNDAGFAEASRVLSDSAALEADRPRAKAAIHDVVVSLGGLQFNAPDAILEDLVTITTFFQNAEAFVDKLIANDPSATQLAGQISATLPDVNAATTRITAYTDRVC